MWGGEDRIISFLVKMPKSNGSGFSTASKQAIAALRIEVAATVAAKDAEIEAERKLKDAEMDAMRIQMLEMAKSLKELQQAPVRGRGRGRGVLPFNTRGGQVGRGRGVQAQAQEQVPSQSQSSMTRKRVKVSPEKSKLFKGVCSDLETDSEDDDDDQQDPRKDEDWKIQKRKGFLKDRENKNVAVKAARISKTKKRNSTEPLVLPEGDEEKGKESKNEKEVCVMESADICKKLMLM